MIYAIIVTYNPNLELLEKQFNALYLQVDGFVYIDNGSINLSDIKKLEKTKMIQDKIIMVYNDKNIGLEGAQNQGIDIAMANGIDHVLSFLI